MSEGGRLDGWRTNRWEKGAIGWHQLEVNESLTSYGEKLLFKPQCRVLVPLCGKTVDLKWMYDGGHTVVGIEGVEQGVLEFFSDQDLQYVTEELSWGKVFKTEDDRLKIYCCDLFKMDLEHLGKFDAVWDRGSLVAIDVEDRERYAEVIKSLVAPDFRYLLHVFHYTSNEQFSGPPRNIPDEVVTNLFGDVWDMQELENVPGPQDRLITWHLDRLDSVTLLLAPRVQM